MEFEIDDKVIVSFPSSQMFEDDEKCNGTIVDYKISKNDTTYTVYLDDDPVYKTHELNSHQIVMR